MDFRNWAKRRQLFREVRGISLLDDVQKFFEKIAINRNREEKRKGRFLNFIVSLRSFYLYRKFKQHVLKIYSILEISTKSIDVKRTPKDVGRLFYYDYRAEYREKPRFSLFLTVSSP